MTKERALKTSELFEDKADLYASARPMYPKELFDFISSFANSHDQAWDCATGNGQAAVGLAEIFIKVEASDISKEQIANSFATKNINYSTQSSEQTSFSDNQFDLVNVAQALHWFDYEKFWGEVNRVLKPDGVFVAYSYVWPFVSKEIDNVLEKSIKSIIEPYWAPNNKLAWDSYAALDFPFTTILCPGIELENHWNLEQYLEYIHTWSGTRRCMDEKGYEFFEAAKEALLQVWGDSKKKLVVKSPLTVIAGRAWT